MTTIVKVIGSALKNGQRIMKAVFGKTNVQEVYEVAPHGIDSSAPDNRLAAHTTTTVKGVNVIYGYYNTLQSAAKGETRIYSTNSAGSNVSIYIHRKNNNTAEFNGNADNLMRYAAFNTVMQNYLTTLNAAILSGVSSAGGSYSAPTAPNFTTAKITELKCS